VFLVCEPLNLRGRPWPDGTKRISLEKDSLPEQALLFDGRGDEISPPPLEGEVDARSAAGWGDSVDGRSC
jgi:hypothetical protein